MIIIMNPMLLPAVEWNPAQLPANEAQRLHLLRSLRLLDTPPEPAFDHITAVGAAICETPMMLISLMDENRQFYKSAFGICERTAPRDTSFCGDVLLSSKTIVVHDASAHPRFRLNPLVTGEPRVRFYAGAPLLRRDGIALGTVCAVDFKPHPHFSRTHLLERLASVTLELIDLTTLASQYQPDRAA